MTVYLYDNWIITVLRFVCTFSLKIAQTLLYLLKVLTLCSVLSRVPSFFHRSGRVCEHDFQAYVTSTSIHFNEVNVHACPQYTHTTWNTVLTRLLAQVLIVSIRGRH